VLPRLPVWIDRRSSLNDGLSEANLHDDHKRLSWSLGAGARLLYEHIQRFEEAVLQ
jgi:hypothetical protein